MANQFLEAFVAQQLQRAQEAGVFPEAAPQGEWDCERCTYHNGERLGFCEMCNYPRPGPLQESINHVLGMFAPPGGMPGGGAADGDEQEEDDDNEDEEEEEEAEEEEAEVDDFHRRAEQAHRHAHNVAHRTAMRQAEVVRGLELPPGAQLHTFLQRAFTQTFVGPEGAEEDEEAGPPPASRRFLQTLQEECLDKEDIDNGNEQCAICFADQHVGDSAVIFPCNHAYHKDCVVPWLERHANCPVCRADISEASAENAARHQRRRAERRRLHDQRIREAQARMREMERDDQRSKEKQCKPSKVSSSPAAEATSSVPKSVPESLGVDGDQVLEDLGKLSVRELKRKLDAKGISYRGVTEKRELVALLTDA